MGTSHLEYLVKRDLYQKVKTDNSNVSILPDSETVVAIPNTRADRIWYDADLLLPGPVSNPVVTYVQKAKFADLRSYGNPLYGTAWRHSTYRNWVSSEYHRSYTLIAYYASPTAPASNITSVIDTVQYPYLFDYASGVLTFIGTIPSYLSSGQNVLYVSGYVYTGTTGIRSVPNMTVSDFTVGRIFPSSNASAINFTQTTLSNINVTRTNTVVVNTLTSDSASVNVNNRVLSNVASVSANDRLITNVLQPFSGTTVSATSNMRIMGDLVVGGNISVKGEFFVVDTTSCNTNQFQVDNDGTGPALIVNQRGVEDIALFKDDQNIVFMIRDGGQSAFGSFGRSQVLTTPSSLVYMYNPAQSNQPALLVRQDNANWNAVQVTTTNKTVAITAQGFVGIGSAAPVFPLEVIDSSAMLIPVGNTTARPAVPRAGIIRYNSELQSFEGYGPGNAWGSLGGVRDVSGNTYITAEQSPGSGDNNLRFFTSGSERMRVNPFGNLGIGTSNPTARLDVSGNANIAGSLWLQNETGGIRFRSSNSSLDASISQSNNGQLVFRSPANDGADGFNFLNSSSSSVVRILQNGNVGIGTTLPSVKLQVEGQAQIRGTFSSPTVATHGRIFFNDSNYGIGCGRFTNNDSLYFHAFDGDQRDIIFSHTTNGSSNTDTASWKVDMIIKGGTGNVGIGTTTPGFRLHVTDSAFIGDIAFTGTATSNVSNGRRLWFDNTSNNIQGAGTPANKVVLFSTPSWIGGLGMESNAVAYFSGRDHTFYTNTTCNVYGTLGMKLQNDGNLGIGTATPLTRLDVLGGSGIKVTQTGQGIRLAPQTAVGEASVGFYQHTGLTGYAWWLGHNVPTAGTSNFVLGNTVNSSVVVALPNGNVGIGTTVATATLDVRGTMNVSNVATFNHDVYLQPTRSLYFRNTQDIGITTYQGGPFIYGVTGGALGVVGGSNTLVWTNTGISVGGTIRSSDTVQAVTVQVDAISTTTLSSNINVSAKSLSNVQTLSVVNITSDLPSINFLRETLSNITSVSTQSLTCEGQTINITGKTLSNVSTISTNNLTSDGASINVSSKSLSNITSLSVQAITSDSKTINITNRNLSNIDSLSVRQMTSDTNVINMSALVLSNVNTILLNTITTDNPSSNINIFAKGLSNVATLSVANITSDAQNINMNTRSLSNVTSLVTRNVFSDTATLNFTNNALSNVDRVFLNELTTTRSHISFMNNTLSNINIVSLNTLTSDAQSINISGKTLSNVATLSVTNITSGRSNIDVSSKNLSNVQTLFANTVQANVISSSAIDRVIDFNNSTLCNVNIVLNSPLSSSGTVQIESLSISTLSARNTLINIISPISVNTITTQAGNGNINISGNSFSNVATLSVNTITSDLSSINISGKTLSNVNTVSTDNLTSSRQLINVSNNVLSNVATLSVSRITSDQQNINVSARNLSNINAVSTNVLTSDASTINVNDKTLSNISALVVNTVRSDRSVINLSGNTLSNISALRVQTIASDSGTIDMSNGTFNNTGTLNTRVLGTNNANNIINASATGMSLQTLYTNSIQPFSGTDVSFNNNNITGIQNLTLSGDLRVRGEFFVTNTTTCNTNQIVIDNDNTGPALVVNQRGTMDVAYFTDDSNIVLAIRDGGQTLMGSFGTRIDNLTFPQSRVFMQNPSSENRSVLVLQQNNSNQDVFTATATSNASIFVISKDGNVGIGTTNPLFDLHVADSAFFGDARFLTTNSNAPNNIVMRFDNTWNGTSGAGVAANKITMYSTSTEKYGFGMENGGLTYHAGGVHNFYTNTGAANYGTFAMRLSSTGLGVGTSNITNRLEVSGNANISQQLFVSGSGVRFRNSASTLDSTIRQTNGAVIFDAPSTDGANGFTFNNSQASNVLQIRNNGNIGIGTASPMALLHVNGSCMATSLQVASITTADPSGAVNLNNKSLSNIASTVATGVYASAVVSTPSITSPGNNVSFSYKRVLDIDTLVVRSNITVELVGSNTYTNLPTDLVRVDPATGRILDQYISTALVRLMAGSNYINPNLLPPVETSRNTLMHTRDRVGVGLKNPQQKLHVHGTQCITSGRLGIGTPYPSSVLHILDNNGPSPTVAIEQQGTVDILQITGSNSQPVMFISANRSVGIQKTNPSPQFALDVAGSVSCTGVQTTSLTSSTGTVSCTGTAFTNVVGLTTTQSGSVATNTIRSQDNVTTLSIVPAVTISGFDTSLFTTPTNTYGTTADATKIGLRVANNVLAQAFLSTSDRRIKRNITDTTPSDSLERTLKINVREFSIVDRRLTGFIAQEVEEIMPSAVRTVTNAIPDIMTPPAYITESGYAIGLPGHVILTGTRLKLILRGDLDVITVVQQSDEDTMMIVIDHCLSEYSPSEVLVYGRVVDDFKLIDTDQLLPLVFDSVKELHKQQTQQYATLLERINTLEEHIFSLKK